MRRTQKEKYVSGLKPIETVYQGYRFRSRLEARWAVFFDTLGLRWEYESEGFDLGDAGWYLPDFWIFEGDSDHKYWIEIKAHRNLSEREYNVARALSREIAGFVFSGVPDVPRYVGMPISFGLPEGGAPADWYRGSWARSFGKRTDLNGKSVDDPSWPGDPRLYCWHERNDGSLLVWPVPACEPNLVGDSLEASASIFADIMKEEWISDDGLMTFVKANPLIAGVKSINSPRLVAAYIAARSARFEHGERAR
jgi:hypothetical protein